MSKKGIPSLTGHDELHERWPGLERDAFDPAAQDDSVNTGPERYEQYTHKHSTAQGSPTPAFGPSSQRPDFFGD